VLTELPTRALRHGRQAIEGLTSGDAELVPDPGSRAPEAHPDPRVEDGPHLAPPKGRRASTVSRSCFVFHEMAADKLRPGRGNPLGGRFVSVSAVSLQKWSPPSEIVAFQACMGDARTSTEKGKTRSPATSFHPTEVSRDTSSAIRAKWAWLFLKPSEAYGNLFGERRTGFRAGPRPPKMCACAEAIHQPMG